MMRRVGYLLIGLNVVALIFLVKVFYFNVGLVDLLPGKLVYFNQVSEEKLRTSDSLNVVRAEGIKWFEKANLKRKETSKSAAKHVKFIVGICFVIFLNVIYLIVFLVGRGIS